ncbi:MAG: ATP-dependent DNA helicase RecG, partial [Candidatus Uhrbacteria bacterium]
MIELLDPVTRLPGIGSTVARDLKKMGVETVSDLLFYFPFRYDDLSKVVSINEVVPGEVATIQGRVTTIISRRSQQKRMMLTEAMIEDQTGRIKVVWFHQPYLAQSLRPGTMISLSGRVDDKYGLSIVNPIYEVVQGAETKHTGRIVPMYSLTGSVTQKRLRTAIHFALETTRQIEDWLPEQVIEEEGFPELSQALTQIHYPEDWSKCQQAINRHKFDELFLHQLMFLRSRADVAKRPAYQIERDQDAENQFISSLPFELTKAQKRSVEEIVSDLSQPHPMNRLLEGDVGSGKSAVAACAIESCLRSGYQAAYLAPTEILARQQWQELGRLFPDYEVLLLTRNVAEGFSLPFQQNGTLKGSATLSKNEVKKSLQSGKIQFVVATHALLQDGYEFHKLGLLVIDEQHRFGVRQRQELMQRAGKIVPHLLSMSATPIPRSLALSIYGDLDISILDELPAGRKPIKTILVKGDRLTPVGPSCGIDTRQGVISLIEREIQARHQVFAVCPLIDPSDKLGAKSVTEFSEELRSGPFGQYRIEILHGKLKPADKSEVIQRFASGQIDILVSTTVVEVGVNIPNATVMFIEGAERFCLAQLHQLRGRVGRADIESYCILHPNSISDISRQRLMALVESQDGFALA